MIDNSIFENLSKVNGYMGSVLSDYTGEVLVSDNGNVKKGLTETSMHFNEVFRTLHQLTESLSLGHTNVMNVESDNAIIIMACSGVETRVHIHAFVIMAKDGSIGLAKMALNGVIDKAVVELTN